MKIFHFHSATGVYLGEGTADESPLEPGVWLIPANATATTPPQPGDGEQVLMVEGNWQVVAIPQPEPEPEPEPEIEPEVDVLQLARLSRAAAFRDKSDPLFFKAQRGEATIEEWQAKVAEIRSLYPYPDDQQ
jgi:hypothetical protein